MYFQEKATLADFFFEAAFYTRKQVTGFSHVYCIFPGDVLEIFFFKRGGSYLFEGFCLAIRRGFNVVDCSFIVRNFIHSIGVECVFSYYYNRLYLLRINEYKKKSFTFTRSKFFFLRKRLHRNTAV